MRINAIILLSGLVAGTAHAAGVELAIQTPNPSEGEYYIAVDDRAQTFPSGEPAHATRTRVNGKSQSVAIEVPDGRYAIAVFQDLNGNSELDTNLVGMPTEPYGFSRDATGAMGPPSFNDAAVDVTDGQWLSIRLRE